MGASSVTIIDPHYDVPVGGLDRISLPALMSSLRRRFREADDVLGGDPAYGFIEVALEVDVDGYVVWSPHFHIVIASYAPAAQIREALEPRRPVPIALMRGRLKRKPIVVKPVDNLANALAYSSKRIPEANVATIDRAGKGVRARRRLTEAEQLEYDRWLCGQRPADRIFKRGMKEVHGKLVPLR